MTQKEIYNGIFIPPEAIGEIRNKLAEMGVNVKGYDKEIETPHVTLEYRGAESMQEYFGESANIKVVGYASDAPTGTRFSGATEGVAVEITFPDNPKLQSKFKTVEITRNETCGREYGFRLHITMSLDGEMKAVETGYLEFREFPEDKQFVIEGGVFGGYMGEGTVDIGTDKEYPDLEVKIRDMDTHDNDANPDADKKLYTEEPNIVENDNDDDDDDGNEPSDYLSKKRSSFT